MPYISCKTCNKEFHVKPSRLSGKKYCSRECRKSRYKTNCLCCGLLFITIPSQNQKYCKKLCASLGKTDKIKTKCLTCKMPLELIQSRAKVNARFCSQNCFQNRDWIDGKRKCKGCNIFYAKDKFAATNENKIGLKPRCIPCEKKYQADARRRRYFNLTPEKHADMLKKQNNGCAICGSSKGKKNFAVDHCHKTGMVRGLLCSSCNTGLGFFKDNPQNLENAIKYLSFVQTDIFVSKS